MQDFLAVGVMLSGALPSPLGEGVCGSDRRRMRGSGSIIAHTWAATVSLSSHPSPSVTASPVGEAFSSHAKMGSALRQAPFWLV